ncbi:MAG: fructosamine kinase family protein [Anaerolineae bacterium]|nr:fructosamine kinase family protein [Anaerolineae bacterium]
MSIPTALAAALAEVLGAPVEQARYATGGDINQAARFEAGGKAYFVKWHNAAPPEMFPAEAHGLRLLAEPGAIRVPAVIAQGNAANGAPAYLLLEYIETGRKGGGATMARFGAALAELHRHTADQHGLDRDNFIGRLDQPNPRTERWAEFYRDQRIGYQMELARQLGRLPKPREDLLTRLLDRLPEILGDEFPASLLHGDLWGGNYLIDTDGEAVLIDPAVCYGHREMDLAMSELFGGFSTEFYRAYQATWPTPDYNNRRALYQLYYIIVHLNLFGESYGGRVDSLAAHYVGRR